MSATRVPRRSRPRSAAAAERSNSVPCLGLQEYSHFFLRAHTHERSLPQTVTGLITETVRLWSLIE